MNSIGRNVKKYRNELGLSIEDLASIAKVSKSMIHEIENNCVNPTVSLLKRISKALHVPICFLINEVCDCNEERK